MLKISEMSRVWKERPLFRLKGNMNTNNNELKMAFDDLNCDNRNKRANAVKVIAKYPNQETLAGILSALNDPKRRVREIAVKHSHLFLNFPKVQACLKAMISNEAEKKKIRNQAIAALLGGSAYLGSLGAKNIDPEVVQGIMQNENYRAAILLSLLQLDLSPNVEHLLKKYVKEGSKDEAVSATKALCGYKVINIGNIEKCQLSPDCELAFGRVYYWVKR